ncbi:hypothetical protein PCASD_16471 [Puccinia coronata f. sp. avenae]|nr:hypothetical protein PCASD_22194 [Puccinia coronata f. sp. avenae]PLW30158.1 hypothetical protein PCASD_16471 [Puccinia coronata f. sp. avenae]
MRTPFYALALLIPIVAAGAPEPRLVHKPDCTNQNDVKVVPEDGLCAIRGCGVKISPKRQYARCNTCKTFAGTSQRFCDGHWKG